MKLRTALAASVSLAVVTTLLAWAPSWRAASSSGTAARADARPLLTADGKPVAPDRVASLRVVRWDTREKAPRVFEVARRNDAWVIPSHFNYPADKGAKVGQTAGGVLNVPRGPLVTDQRALHAEFGVVDPLREGMADEESRGQRVTLKDQGGATLVDLIVGKPVASPAAGAPDTSTGNDLRYVREADSDAVYTAKVDLDNISTSFRDWVETDLLKISRPAIREVSVLDYNVDAARGTIQRRASTTFRKGPGSNDPWTSDKTPAGQRVNTTALSALLDEATSLRLVGVRPFDPAWLQSRGFYVAQRPDGMTDIVGDEGSLELATDDGLRYRLFFGSIALGDDQDTAAKVTTKPATAATSRPASSSTDAPNRYLAVFVEYDPSLQAAASPATTQPTSRPAAAPTTQQVADGQKLAADKMARFGKFFYVISDDSFRRLRPQLDQLFESDTVDVDKLPGEKVPAGTSPTTAPSGLSVIDLKPGTGPDAAADGDTVSVRYTGWLESNGTQFDSNAAGEPFTFTLGQGAVIKGWDQGVKGMKPGGKRKLIIPPDLAYGAAGSPPKIPPHARLVFDVELLSIKKSTPHP